MEDVQSDQSEDETLPNLPDTDNPDEAYYSDNPGQQQTLLSVSKINHLKIGQFYSILGFYP